MKLNVLIALIIFNCTGISYAGDEKIVIEVQVSTTVTGSAAEITVAFNNKGKVDIFDVRAKLQSELMSAGFDPLPQLQAGKLKLAHIKTRLPDSLIGRSFFVPVHITYMDRNSTTLSTIAMAHFGPSSDGIGQIAIALEESNLKKRCQTTNVSIQNMLESDMNLMLRLVTVASIVVNPERQSIFLPASRSVDVEFELCNQPNGTNGSYPLFVITSVRRQGYVSEELFNSRVNINIASAPLRFFQNQLLVTMLSLAAFIILCASWLYTIFKPTKPVSNQRYR